MYKLILSNGAEIPNLTRLNPSTFETQVDSPLELYFLLSDANLDFATLYNDDELDTVFIGAKRLNFYSDRNTVLFRISNT